MGLRYIKEGGEERGGRGKDGKSGGGRVQGVKQRGREEEMERRGRWEQRKGMTKREGRME